ncbi:hypothetical protein Y032_0064g3563 [Ancylostoma ceylanicum]|uniref:Uncharacterized protein n=1 Tax=Ancylostoma ceylanicum TaxID=53326 RepID=A0A016U1H1_9BILA|nr:hypothetical protein Y032_0064g3563 [Ancylostoma ceylanicum]
MGGADELYDWPIGWTDHSQSLAAPSFLDTTLHTHSLIKSTSTFAFTQSNRVQRASMAVAFPRPRKTRDATAPLTVETSAQWRTWLFLIVVHQI